MKAAAMWEEIQQALNQKDKERRKSRRDFFLSRINFILFLQGEERKEKKKNMIFQQCYKAFVHEKGLYE